MKISMWMIVEKLKLKCARPWRLRIRNTPYRSDVIYQRNVSIRYTQVLYTPKQAEGKTVYMIAHPAVNQKRVRKPR